MIPLVDVKAQYAPLIPELKERFAEVLESGRFIFGPEVEAFELESAAYLDVPYAIGVANGTDALVLSLEAMGIGAGDEVICPSFTFYATAEAIARVGRDARSSPTSTRSPSTSIRPLSQPRITPRTKAIMPVHLFGRPAPLAELAGLGLPLIEDAAQAFGAAGVASTGVCSTFSFFPTKNLFALGDGGLVAVRDDEVAERLRMLRFHGSRDKQTFELIGTNSRLDARPGRGAAGLSAAPRRVERRPAGGGRALRGARPRRPCRAAARRRASTSTTCTSSAPRSARDRSRAEGRRHRLRVVLRDPAAPAARPPLSRL